MNGLQQSRDQARASGMRSRAASKTATNKSPNSVDRHVGARVRLRRMQLTMSQETLAKKLSLTFQQVQKYEKGANRIGASRLLQIAKALGTTVSYFFEGVEDHATTQLPEGSANIPAFLASREGLVLIRSFQRIESTVARAATLRIVETIATASTEAAERKLGKH
jgi:transcriptional regulator with XRE-family HTH domain